MKVRSTTLVEDRTHSEITKFAWVLVFEFLLTICWFSRAWVAKPANWIANKRFTQYGYKPDWGINAIQYLFLPILPFVTLGLGFIAHIFIHHHTQDVWLSAAFFALAVIYASGGIHLDGFVDTVDAMNCHDKDKWQVMKEPYLGGLGAYNLNLYQVFYSFGLAYLATFMSQARWLVVLLGVSFVMARINMLHIVPMTLKSSLFRPDEIVHLEAPYSHQSRAFSQWVVSSHFRWAFGIILTALLGFGASAAGLFQINAFVLQVAATLCIVLFTNKVIMRKVSKDLGFLSGDTFGFSITMIEAMSLGFTLVAYKAGWY